MADYTDLEPMLRGQWPEFITSVTGYSIPHFKGTGHECPQCGGDDRAHWRQRDGRVALFCRGACGTSDSAYGSNTMTPCEQFVMQHNGWSFNELCQAAADFLRVSPKDSKKSKNQQMSQELKNVIASAKHLRWQDSEYCSRYACAIEPLYDIGGFPSVPLVDFENGETKAFLIIGGYGKQKVVGAAFTERLCYVIGKSKGGDCIFFTNITAAFIFHKKTGLQCLFSPSYKLFKKTNCNAVFVKDGNYETLIKAVSAYGVTEYIWPLNDENFEFENECEWLDHDQLCERLTEVEIGSL